MPPLVGGRFWRRAVYGIVYDSCCMQYTSTHMQTNLPFGAACLCPNCLALIPSHEMNTKLDTPHCLPCETQVTSHTVTRDNRPARSTVSKQEQAIDWSSSRERGRACWPPSVAQHHDIPRTAVLEREFTHFRVAEEVGVAHKFLDRPCVCRTHAA